MKNDNTAAILLWLAVMAFLLLRWMGCGLDKHSPEIWGPPALYLALLAAMVLRAFIEVALGWNSASSTPPDDAELSEDTDAPQIAEALAYGVVHTLMFMFFLCFGLGAGFGWLFCLPMALFVYLPILVPLFSPSMGCPGSSKTDGKTPHP